MTKSEGRDSLALRPVKIQRKPMKYAEGSARISAGNTRVLCSASVESGKPRWMKSSPGGWITAEYSLIPRSTHTRSRRERGNISGRTQEIQRLIGRSLRAGIDLEALEDITITVDCDVIQADGGTRTAAVTGGFVALYEACKKLYKEKKVSRFPVTDFVAAVSVGIVEGEIMLDLDYPLDSSADVDMNVVMSGSGKIIEIQGTAERDPFSRAQLDKMLSVAAGGIKELIAAQKKALRIS
ncbi:MAG: ribonuclease PH [bacterium]